MIIFNQLLRFYLFSDILLNIRNQRPNVSLICRHMFENWIKMHVSKHSGVKHQSRLKSIKQIAKVNFVIF